MTLVRTSPKVAVGSRVLGVILVWALLVQTASAQITFHVQSFTPYKTIQEFVVALLNVFIIIATPIVVIFIILAGFFYVTARGNVEQVKKATRALTYAVIGGVLILGAVVLSEIIQETISAFQA